MPLGVVDWQAKDQAAGEKKVSFIRAWRIFKGNSHSALSSALIHATMELSSSSDISWLFPVNSRLPQSGRKLP